MNKLSVLNWRLICIAGFFMTLTACLVLLFPATQNSIILFGEFLVQRPLNHPLWWQARFAEWGTRGIVMLFVLYFPLFLRHIFPQAISARALVNIYAIFVMAFAVAPIIYFGQDAIITIHDNLDSYVPWLKMLKDNGLLLALDSPTNCFGNMSTAYFAHVSYNLILLPYLLFDVFTAHVIGYAMKIVMSYAFMFLLLRHLFSGEEHAPVIKLVSLSFALLPAGASGFWIAMPSVPLLCYCFCVIKELTPAKIDKRVFLLVLFPVFSNFPFAGFFLLCLWASGTVAVWLYKKKFNWNLVFGLLSLTVGYILVDLKLFYAKFVLQEPLNRVLVNQYKISFMEALKTAPANFLYGQEHAPIVASKLIFPVVFLTLLSIAAFIIYKISKNAHEKKYENLARYIFSAIILLGLSVLFSLVGTFYNCRPVVDFVNTALPFLKGFNWGRFSFLNRTVLYILFALTLITLSQFRKMRYFAYIIACLQILVVLLSNNMYNYFYINLENIGRGNREGIAYNEFFQNRFSVL